jgi:hypothetical protein
MEDLTFYPLLGDVAIWTCLPNPYTAARLP